MIYSMTGFAVGSKELPSGALSLELRAVNHRYLDVTLRMPDEFRSAESAMRERLAGKLTRGKVECRINFTSRSAAEHPARLNPALLAQVAQWSNEIQALMPDARQIGVADILRWPGMLESEALPPDVLRDALLVLLEEVLAEFGAARGREGEKLKAFLLERVAGIERWCDDTAPRIPQAVAAYEERLTVRLREALGSGDEERIRQEVVVFATRVDVDEELSRLRTHLAEMRRILDKGGVVGKRLDFLMQELNREANTLGSKAVDVEVSRASMEIKLLIEQMREQIQNLE
jgi:uncharacterized protein (TIGR00255 family)